MSEANLGELWQKVKETVADVELDVVKGVAGNTAAQARGRKGLRQLKREIGDLVKAFQVSSNEIKTARKAEKTATKA